jgi:phytoene dehydrogenase-like protein
MMRTVERVIPDIRARTVFADIGTPLTHVHYCNSTRGNWYGTEKTLGQLGPRSYGLKSDVAGLYLCGASTVMHGVSGATLSGLAAAARALGVRPSELLTSQGPSLRLVPAEQPEAWPEDLRAKFGGAEAQAEE